MRDCDALDIPDGLLPCASEALHDVSRQEIRSISCYELFCLIRCREREKKCDIANCEIVIWLARHCCPLDRRVEEHGLSSCRSIAVHE
jgi:hypothetical protein